MKSSDRELFYDQLKGVAIVGVVYIHSLSLISHPSYAALFTSDLFRISVPFFIVTFSFFIEKSIKKRDYKNFYVKRITSLIYPFVFWSVLYFILSVDISEIKTTPHAILTKHFSGYGWAGQYFFILCFQVLLFFPLIRTITFKNKAYPIFIFFLTSVTFLYLTYNSNNLPTLISKISDRAVIYWLPYVFLGIVLANSSTFKVSKSYLLVTVIVLSVPLEYLLFVDRDDIFSPYTMCTVLVSTCVAATALFLVKPQLSGMPGRVLSIFGQRSMAIFVMNPLIIKFFDFCSLTFEGRNQAVSYIYSFGITVMICLLICLIAELIKRSPMNKII
ncbi:MAG TPA: hypothetical protein DG048_10665 [Pseudoalteromonas sp.]|nr:hypothetical protein [Pseudoalteromonas sp.]|tara:strand:+ start:480 stop:1472 length:993 start_codon:yes stop_codon:yes gene_type:complete